MEVTSMTTKRRPANDAELWTTADLRKLKRLAKEGTPMTVVAKALGRTPAAVQMKAMRSGISFRLPSHLIATRQ
jgi:tRNA A37 threonylcarbamoyladenosine synthetase subunit TsaC/SUA5/YrdC